MHFSTLILTTLAALSPLTALATPLPNPISAESHVEKRQTYIIIASVGGLMEQVQAVSGGTIMPSVEREDGTVVSRQDILGMQEQRVQNAGTIQESSLDDLNDDVLLEIMAILKESATTAERRERRCANAPDEDHTSFPGIDEVDHSAALSPRAVFRPRILGKFFGFFADRKRLSAASMMEQAYTDAFSNKTQDTESQINSPRPNSRPQRVFGSLQTLSMANKRLRELAAPKLLRSITIGPDVNWNNALTKLDTVSTCEAVKVYTKNFFMDIYTGPSPEEGRKRIPNWRGPRPPQRMPDVLSQSLAQMTNLQKLTLFIPEHHTKGFQRSFGTSTVIFPNIQTLVLGPHLEWIVAKCPNVEVISTCDYRWLHWNADGKNKDRHHMDLIKAAARAKRLRHFEMHDEWSSARLEDVCQTMPSIQILGMPSGAQHYGIEALLPNLGRFRDVKILVLTDAHLLKVGFHPPWCGNVYMGPNGQRVRELVKAQRLEAKARVANMVFATIQSLETLWIGDFSKASVARTHCGNEITWDDTPRLKPYREHWDGLED
ncbi:MAG: hypothetical protein Q9174_003561 [Haloplaca sp. 1 TL-2023]